MRLNKLTTSHLLLFVIIALAAFLRFYKVSTTPHDMYVDEVAIGWNAYSILKTGRDEYGTFLPLSFRSFGDYKLPVYIYMTAVTESVFGKTPFAVRLPSAFFGTVTILVFYLFLKLLTKQKSLALLGAFFLAISPWHLQFSRGAFESNVSHFFILTGAYLLLRTLIKNRPFSFWGGLCFVISFYTYHTARIFVPLFSFLLLFLWWKKNRLSIKKVFLNAKFLILFALTIPFLVYALSPQGLARAEGESFMKDDHNMRETFVSRSLWAINSYGKDYLQYFSLDFRFFSGDQIGRHSVRELGMHYMWQLPFYIVGLWLALKRRSRNDLTFIGWFLLAPLAGALATPNPHALRGMLLLIPDFYFISSGLLFTVKRFRFATSLKLVITAISIYYMISYLHIYYVHYPRRTGPDWTDGYREAMQYVGDHAAAYDRVEFTSNDGNYYVYLYFYGNFDPRVIQQNADRIHGTGKFFFVRTALTHPEQKTLFVGIPTDSNKGHFIKTIPDLTGNPVFYVWEN